jgi:hypothetical protein
VLRFVYIEKPNVSSPLAAPLAIAAVVCDTVAAENNAVVLVCFVLATDCWVSCFVLCSTRKFNDPRNTDSTITVITADILMAVLTFLFFPRIFFIDFFDAIFPDFIFFDIK